MLTIDGTSDGDYENCATSLLFKTKEEAEDYVESDFIDDVVNDGIVGDDPSADELAKAIEEHCQWYGEWQAQFRHGNARTDYKIEEVSIPS